MNTILLCITICIVRIIDTSLSTIRTILTIRNKKRISTIIAFFEVLVWFTIVKEAINTQENAFLIAISYSLGYALGVLFGMLLTDRFVTSNIIINVVIKNNKREVTEELIKHGFAYSIYKINGHDINEKKHMLIIVTTNKKMHIVEEIVKRYDKKPFIIITESKQVKNGII